MARGIGGLWDTIWPLQAGMGAGRHARLVEDGPDRSIKAQGKNWAFCEHCICPCHCCSPPVGDTGPRGCGSCHLPASLLVSSAPWQPHTLQRPGRDVGSSQSWYEGCCCLPRARAGKVMGWSLAESTVGPALGAPLPRPKHPGRSPPSAGYVMSQHVLCAGDWGSIQPSSSPSSLPSILLSLCPSYHLSVPPSLLPTVHPYTPHCPAQPPGCFHFPCSFLLPSCRSRSCQHPTPQAPHPQENGAGASVVISIRSPFQHFCMQSLTHWLCHPLPSWQVPSYSPFCLGISILQALCPGQSRSDFHRHWMEGVWHLLGVGIWLGLWDVKG